MIRALLGRPNGASEWLAISFIFLVCLFGLWVASAGFVVLVGVTQPQQVQSMTLARALLGVAAPAAIATHWLLWWQVLRGAWAMCQDKGHNYWLLAGAVLWWLMLGSFQLLCLLCWLEPPAAPTSGPPWLQF